MISGRSVFSGEGIIFSFLTLVFAGILLCTSAAYADMVIDFTNTNGYGLESDRVMIENIRVDITTTNPFDLSRPEIVTNNYNVPFRFDRATLHLVPDLGASVAVNDNTTCARLEVYVTDAFTGGSIENALVEVGSDYAYADTSGLASFAHLVSGTVQIEGSAQGYVGTTSQVTLSCEETTSVGLAMSPESGEGALAANEVRAILTWGENPADLDSHLTGPDDENNRFHVYYSAPTSDVANLDVDDVTSYGPETITLTPPNGSSSLRPGIYRYSVHHFSGSSNISSSNAGVNLQIGGTSRTYTPPSGATGVNDVWTVFELSVDSNGGVTVYDVDTIAAGSGSFSVLSPPIYGTLETRVDHLLLPSK